MTDWSVVGVKRMDFDGRDGKVTGVKVYVEAEDPRVEGLATDLFWFDAFKAPNMQSVAVGDHINAYYNRYGKVDGGMIL